MLIQSIARRSLGSARAASVPYDTVEHGERIAGHRFALSCRGSASLFVLSLLALLAQRYNY